MNWITAKKSITVTMTVLLLCDLLPVPELQARSRAGMIDQIEITDSERSTVVHIRGDRLGSCQPVTMKDPKGRNLPKVFLVIYDTALSEKLAGMQPGKGAVASLQASLVTDKPSPISQVVIDLAADWPSQVRSGREITVEVEKKGNLVPRDSRPSQAKPDPAALIKSDQLVQSGDSLYFAVSPAEELSRDLVVDQNGKISIPLIGAIPAAGLSTDELSRKITQELSRYVSSPKVDIFLKQSSNKQVGVSGQVGSPNSYALRPNMRLLDLIALAGGFLPSANKRQIRLLRRSGAERRLILVNAEEALVSGDTSKDVLLEAGDIIEVPRGTTGITIFGQVMRPGSYDYIHDMRMLDLVSLCHGFQDSANLRRITIIRGEPPHQTMTVVRFNSVLRNRSDGNIKLQPGDVVYVPQRSIWAASAFANALSPITMILMTVATVILATRK
ncbi:MAG: SLBB domain-containing protein [Elusimicrobiota bacterium]|jgi:polysaccharide export outer membrane protein